MKPKTGCAHCSTCFFLIYEDEKTNTYINKHTIFITFTLFSTNGFSLATVFRYC